MHRQTNVKTVCADVAFLAMLDLLDIELSSRAREDEEEKRRQKSASVATTSAATGKGSGKSKPATTKPTCIPRMDALVMCNALSSIHLQWADASGVDQQNMRLLSANSQDRRRPHFHPRVKVNHHNRRHHLQRPTTTTKVEAKVTQEQWLRMNQSQKVRRHQNQRQKLDTFGVTGLPRPTRILVPHLQ